MEGKAKRSAHPHHDISANYTMHVISSITHSHSPLYMRYPNIFRQHKQQSPVMSLNSYLDALEVCDEDPSLHRR